MQSFHMMMTQSVSFIVLVHMAALLINTLSYCSAENVYCVTPTATSCSSCPHNSTNCTTLSEYAQEAELYFTSNTTMVFLPGDHVLDRNITVANVASLTMRGESSSGNVATVVRNGSVGFSFTNMVDFNIYSLAFTSYNNQSLSYGSQLSSKSAVFVQSSQNTKLVNCSFHDNLGTAVTVHNTDVTMIDSQFTHNLCGYELFSDNRRLGCGITALNSKLSFNGTSTFSYNSAEVYGGAIHVEMHSSLHFLGTSTFSSNRAGYDGGAINAYDNAVLIFNGTNNFINNSANGDGGAINAYDGVLVSLTGASSFSSNSANQGGAITAYYNSTLTFGGNISFTNNTANSHGGAMYLYIRSTFSILPHTTVRWKNNHANLGGAIYVYDSNPRIYCNRFTPKEECFFQLPGHNLSYGINSIEMQLFFKNNSADTAGSVLYGGAIDNCTLNDLESRSSGEVFDMLVQYERDNTTSSISSDPFRI